MMNHSINRDWGINRDRGINRDPGGGGGGRNRGSRTRL